MARPEKPVDAAGGAVAAFANELRKLRARAGHPTYREMARVALYSSSVLSSAASGTRLPTLQVTLGFVAACGGDREEWRQRWMRTAGATATESSTRNRGRASPGRTALPRPAQLPWRTGRLVGRQAELARLRTRVATPVLIAGPPGVGKSALALHHAREVAAEMTDGQLYADFGSLTGTPSDLGYVLDGFLHALGLPVGSTPQTLDQRAGLYRSILAERRLLVLLDNVRDERQVRPLLTESRRSTTLLTSRAPLLGLVGVHRMRLEVLPRCDSIEMIMASVPERARNEPTQCDRLAQLCGDLPLALDIALRKLAARPDLSLRAATVRIADDFGALDWLQAGDLSLRGSLNSAYQQLSDAAKLLLHRVARLALRWDPESVVPDGRELAEELTDAGLLHCGGQPGTYRMARLVRAFVIELERSQGDQHEPVPWADQHEPVPWGDQHEPVSC